MPLNSTPSPLKQENILKFDSPYKSPIENQDFYNNNNDSEKIDDWFARYQVFIEKIYKKYN